MRRLYLVAVVFAFACGAPPTGVEQEFVGDDASLNARKAPRTGGQKRNGPSNEEIDDRLFCAQDADGASCSQLPRGPAIEL